MKKIILIIGAVVVAAMVIGVGAAGVFWFLSPRQSIVLPPAAPAHGTSFLLESDDANNAALRIALQRRFSDLCMPIFLETVSPTQIRVVTPMVENEQNRFALEHITGGHLEFRLVHPDSQSLIASGLVQPGYEMLKLDEATSDERAHAISLMVKNKPEMTGKYVQNAMVTRDQVGQPEIEFTLTTEGTEIFAKLTRNNIGRNLAIVVDGKVVSAPRIQSEIPGGNGVITGHFTDGEAAALAGALNHPLPVPVKVIEMKKF